MAKNVIQIKKIALSLLTAVAMFYLTAISNILCIGPIYQPSLPKESRRFKKHL